MSFQQFAPGGSVGFLHTHRPTKNFTSSSAETGSSRSTAGLPRRRGERHTGFACRQRSLRNTGDSPMTMICIQYKAASFDAGDAADGEILPDQVVW